MLIWQGNTLRALGEDVNGYRDYDADYLFWLGDVSGMSEVNDPTRTFLQRFNGSLLKLQGKALRKAGQIHNE